MPEILLPLLEAIGSVVEEVKYWIVDDGKTCVVVVGSMPLSSWITVVYVVYDFVMLSVT